MGSCRLENKGRDKGRDTDEGGEDDQSILSLETLDKEFRLYPEGSGEPLKVLERFLWLLSGDKAVCRDTQLEGRETNRKLLLLF